MNKVFHLSYDYGNVIRFRVYPQNNSVRIDYKKDGNDYPNIYIHELGGIEGNTFLVSCGVAITIELARDLWRHFVGNGWKAEKIYENPNQPCV